MTIEDAITIFHGLESNPLFSEKHLKAFDKAIKSLYMWGEVKAEIEELEIVYESYFTDDTRTDAQKSADWWKMDKQIVLQIINKHLQEVTE